MSDQPTIGHPVVTSTTPDRKDILVHKPRMESEDEREMNDALFLERVQDDINSLRLVEDGVFGHLPKTRAWRDEALQIGMRLIEDHQLRQVRQFAAKTAKIKGLSDPAELESRSIMELAIRMGRFWVIDRETPIGKKEVQEQFFGTNPNKIEIFNPKGSEYSVSSIVKQQASHVRKVLNSPDSGKMILLGDLHETAGASQSAEDRRKGRMERETGAMLDNPEKFVDGVWTPVEGHNPDDKNTSHVTAYLRSDARDAVKGWHMGQGAMGGSVVTSMHDVTLMRAADAKYNADVWNDAIRRSLQSVLTHMVNNGWTKRKMAKANPDNHNEIYADKSSQAEEILLRCVEGLKQAITHNAAIQEMFADYKPNMTDYLLNRYLPEEVRERNARFAAQPGTVYDKPGTKIQPGMKLPDRTIPVWNEENGTMEYIPDGVERIAEGYRFGAGWDIGRMGDVLHRRRMDYRTMSNELNVSEADIRLAMPQLARKVTKLAKMYIDNMAVKQAERDSRLQDHLNTFEPAEGMQLTYRVPPTPERVLPIHWGRYGTGIVDGFVPGETELPYEKWTSITIHKVVDGEGVDVQKHFLFLDPALFQVAQEKNELCPSCNDRPLGGKFQNGTKPNECAHCRNVDVFVPSRPYAEMIAIQKSWM